MSFAIALDLGHFVERFPLRPPLGIVAIEGLLGRQRDVVKHQPVGQVAVVRDREDPTAGLLLVVTHPLPKVLGIDAVVL